MDEVLHAMLGPDPALTLGVAFLQVNLAVAAAILAVVAARIPARRMVGPRLAYDL